MKCYADDCTKDAHATGLCMAHYQRLRRNGTLEAKKTLLELDPTGRVCNKCDEHKPWTEFYKVRNGYFAQCKTCYKAYQKVQRDARRGQEGA